MPSDNLAPTTDILSEELQSKIAENASLHSKVLPYLLSLFLQIITYMYINFMPRCGAAILRNRKVVA